MLEKTFGIKEENEIYLERVGAYGVAINKEGKIAVAITSLFGGKLGYFLPGKEIHGSEKLVERVKKEFIEVGRMDVTPEILFCRGDYYHKIQSINTFFRAIGYFYFVNIDKMLGNPNQPNYNIMWMTIDEAIENLTPSAPHHAWATQQIYDTFCEK